MKVCLLFNERQGALSVTVQWSFPLLSVHSSSASGATISLNAQRM